MTQLYVLDLQPIDWDDFFLFKDGSFNGLQAYKNSKAANVMFALELAKRLEDSGVKVNAVCPGGYHRLLTAVKHAYCDVQWNVQAEW